MIANLSPYVTVDAIAHGEAVLVDHRTELVVALNAGAYTVLRTFLNGSSWSECCTHYAALAQRAPEEAMSVIENLFHDLVANGWIESRVGPPARGHL